MSPDDILYKLPYARGLQLLSLQLYSTGNKFLGPELAEGEGFSAIAGIETDD